MNRTIRTVGAVLLALLATESWAQNAWHLGLVGAAARSGVSNRGSIMLTPWPSGQSIGYRQDNAATYHVGLQLSRDLTPRLTLEAEPRYSRLVGELSMTLGRYPDVVRAYGRAVGGVAQLPLGVRWRLTRPGPATLHLLARVVPGLAQTNPYIPLRLEYASNQTGLMNIGFGGAGLHGQLGLEGGVGVLVRGRVGLNVLVHHGLGITRLAAVSAMMHYEDDQTAGLPLYQQPSYSVDGFFDGHLNAVSFQAVAYFN